MQQKHDSFPVSYVVNHLLTLQIFLGGSRTSVWQPLQWTHVRCHVCVPESQSSPVKVQEEGGVMLPKTGHKGRG